LIFMTCMFTAAKKRTVTDGLTEEESSGKHVYFTIVVTEL